MTPENAQVDNLITCPACKNQCSPLAPSCPKCGHPLNLIEKTNIINNIKEPLSNSAIQNKDSSNRKTSIIIGGIVIGSLLLFISYKVYSNYKETEAIRIKADIQSEEQKKIADEALKALKKLDAATDVGIDKIDYSKILIDAQVSVNQATNKLPDGELKREIKLAFDSFMDAKDLWTLPTALNVPRYKDDGIVWVCAVQPDITGKDQNERSIIDMACNREGGDLTRKYKIPIRDQNGFSSKDGEGLIVKEEGISIIWKSAEEHLSKADALQH